MAKSFPASSAERLLETFDPVSIIIAVMEAAKARGWVNGFAVMETEAGSTATVTTKDGLSETMQSAIREALAEVIDDRPTEVVSQLRDLAAWLGSEGHHDLGAHADDLADSVNRRYPSA